MSENPSEFNEEKLDRGATVANFATVQLFGYFSAYLVAQIMNENGRYTFSPLH